jgi:hypothetical protein
MDKKNSIKPEKNEACTNLDDLKVEYDKFKNKYDLPNFTDLNRLFDVEEVNSETEFFLRKIRRTMSDRISAYIRFVEIIINPSNAPLFFFKLVKKLGSSDKEKLSEVYDKLSIFEVDIISLDLDYSEEKEALFIKKAYYLFENEIRFKLIDVLDKLVNNKGNAVVDSNGSYFG